MENPLFLIVGGGLIAYALIVKSIGREMFNESAAWGWLLFFGILLILAGFGI
jgi:hypothetical protein